MFFIGLALWPAVAHALLTTSDVSTLLPLPNRAEWPQLLAPTDRGLGGELLPRQAFGQLPNLVIGGNPHLIYQDQLRVVALRIDPCFQEGAAPLKCRRQIRLVWQPLEFPKDRARASAIDAAAHSFYDLSEQHWDTFLTELRELSATRSEASDVHLDLHPQIVKEGLGGVYWSQLRALILKYAGLQNLSRVTGMNVDPIGSLWIFSGIEVDQENYQRIRIPRVDRGAQGFFIDPKELSEFRAKINPYPENQLAFLNLVADSKSRDPVMDRAELIEALNQANRLENPELENTGSVDCVSCHIAQSVRLWGERKGLQKLFEVELRPTRFDNPNVTKISASGFINRLRAFGYFLDEANVSRRTDNETQMVLQSVNSF